MLQVLPVCEVRHPGFPAQIGATTKWRLPQRTRVVLAGVGPFRAELVAHAGQALLPDEAVQHDSVVAGVRYPQAFARDFGAFGVDVACHLGVASKSPLRFFRTATAGAFGAAAAIGRLAGFDAATLVNAFGAVLGQLSGTMQAHVEGSPLLGMQVGFGARNAIVACDMAARGLAAPQAALWCPRLEETNPPRRNLLARTPPRTPLRI